MRMELTPWKDQGEKFHVFLQTGWSPTPDNNYKQNKSYLLGMNPGVGFPAPWGDTEGRREEFGKGLETHHYSKNLLSTTC